MSKIVISIEYAGLQLQVTKNDQGEAVTPLKPISDLFGLRWERQREKVTNRPNQRKFYGVCTRSLRCGKQTREQTCIQLSKVKGYIARINPRRVRVNGNEDGAALIERMTAEWVVALHAYREAAAALDRPAGQRSEARQRQYETLRLIIETKANTEDQADRQALAHIVQQMAGELGIPYQLDLDS